MNHKGRKGHKRQDILVRAAVLADASAVGRLWWLAFADKFGPILGPDGERNVALLTDLHRAGDGRMLRSTLVAKVQDSIAGFLLHHSAREGFGDFPLIEGWRAFERHLGAWGALRALLRLAANGLESARPPRGHAVVEMVGVAPQSRGQGIGRALMTAAITRARADGAPAVTLEVVWGNDPARRLYESLGFVIVAEKRSRRYERLSGHRGWTRMTLGL